MSPFRKEGNIWTDDTVCTEVMTLYNACYATVYLLQTFTFCPSLWYYFHVRLDIDNYYLPNDKFHNDVTESCF